MDFFTRKFGSNESPVQLQEDENQTNPKEFTEIPVVTELLSPIGKAKNDLETDTTLEQLQSFRAHRNLTYWIRPIKQEALFYC